MDKNKLKVFAIESRNELYSKMIGRLDKLGITKKGMNPDIKINPMGKDIEIDGELFSNSSYNNLIKRYEEIGYDQLVEESAYIWFNRLVAFAYMEANNYVEERFIFSKSGQVNPEIINNYYETEIFEDLDDETKNKLHNLRDKNSVDSIDEMYSILLEEKCDKLNNIMPFMFDKKGGYSDILFPKNLLSPDSFLIKLREIFENSKEYNEEKEEDIVPVEIIGWLYQYYNQEKREVIYDGSMKKSKISKDYIAPATQLFTPHWIVKYMAENSLGKLVLESYGADENLKDNWKYYIENKKNENEEEKERLKIEDLKIIDPAMGSGHMLTYCFDLLIEIYDNLGWSKKDAILSILKNNIYGLELDKRAGQLASFAIMMKGREYFSRLFRTLERLEEDEKFNLNTLWIAESNNISENIRKIIYENSLKNLEKLLSNFNDAKEYGSILKLDNINIEELKNELEKAKEIYRNQGQLSLSGNFTSFDFEKECKKIEKLILQQKILQDRYDIVITNPPYMGNARMNPKLKEYIEKYYQDVKSDLFSVFFNKCSEICKKNGYLGFMSPFVWMFIKSYEQIRYDFINNKNIISLIQLEYSGFEDATVPICTFVLQNSFKNKKGEYIRLSDFKGAKNQPIKTLEAIENPNCGWRYKANQKEFKKIPGSPIAYWVSDKIREAFENNKKLGEVGEAKQGLATADNNRFLRLWNEVNYNKIGFGMENSQEALESNKKWFPFNKGGEYRKWYGNQEYLVNWENDGYEIKNFYDNNGKLRSRPQNTEYYFRKSISWSKVSSGTFSMRFYPKGFIFADAGMSLFTENLTTFLSLCNSTIFKFCLGAISPTLNFEVGHIVKLPIKEILDEKIKKQINTLVQQNIDIAKEEWDSRETSWDFKNLSLSKGNSIELAYNNYCNHWTDNFVTMHKNEEELNKMFIDIYDLNDEMDKEIPFEEITLLKDEAKIEGILIPPQNIEERDEREKTSNGYLYNRGVKLQFNKEEIIKQFLSYAVGCIMGRYSIDKEGLIIANSDDVLENNNSNILIKDREGNIRHNIENPRFFPDEYGIIPITLEKVFDNDIVTKVIEFIKALYGEETYEENIKFICEALGKKSNENYEDCLREYFVKDFYADHIKRYQKRPIYWLANSGKKNGFQALIYLHRYDDNTMGRLRTEYLLNYQEKVEKLKIYYDKLASDETTVARDKKVYDKKVKEYETILIELRDFANDLKSIVEQNITLDLDNGVKDNYNKFGSILKKI